MEKQITSLTSSRRGFFQKTAVLFGAGAVATRLMGQSTTTPGGQPAAGAPTDLDVLQYALTLENLEAAFYTQGLAKFAAGDFNSSNFVQNFGSKVGGNLYGRLTEIRDHEQAHVVAISAVVKQLGGTPVPPCTYNFGYKTADDFIMIGMALENTGVSAYDYAIGLLTNPDIIQAGATIATVEARHASYLNFLNGTIPFPTPFDQPKTMQEVLAIAGQFIVSCPVPPTTPVTPAANPNAPTLAGISSTINTRDSRVNLDASGSTSVTGQAVSFSFTQVSGGTANINGQNTSTPSIVLLGGAGTYVFQAKVTDQAGNTTMRMITVNYTP